MSIRPGEVHALLGENGAGKSTLMKVLSGAQTPDAGTMTLDGEPYAPRGPEEARRHGVAMIYQELNLAPHLSVEENLFLGREQTQWGFIRRAAHRPRINEVLARLGAADVHPQTLLGTLSPGNRQLIEVARALLEGARVVIMDEPTSSLTRTEALRLFEIIRDLARGGCAVIYISHFMDEIREVADRFTVLRDGETVGAGDISSVTDDELITLMAGRPVERNAPPPSPRLGDVLLHVTNLSGVQGPQGASITVRRGEIVGITGLVGAGRTEFLRAIFGLDHVRSGAVRVAAHEFGMNDDVGTRWRHRMGMVSEDRKGEGLMVELPISTNITLSQLAKVSRAGFVQRSALQAQTSKWMTLLGIRAGTAGSAVSSLSGGNQQKVALARLLHHDVDLLLLDEPTRGIDVRSKGFIWNFIRELATQGKGILIVGSHLAEMLAGCDSLAVMCHGRLGPVRPVAEWTEHALLSEATAVGESRHD